MKSRLYAVILAMIVLGYGFFFASRFIFHEDRSLLYTELNTTQKLSETVSLTLKKWVYWLTFALAKTERCHSSVGRAKD